MFGRHLLQYVALAAPVFVPAAAQTPVDNLWRPSYVDRVPAKPRTVVYQPRTEPAPVFVPAPADAPQTMDRWRSTYPDRVPIVARSQPTGGVATVFVVSAADAPQTVDRWTPRYVDRAPTRARRVPVFPYTSQPTPAYIADLTDPLQVRWRPTYPDWHPAKRLRTGAHPALFTPFVQPQPIFEGGRIIALGSIRTLLQYQAVTGPFQEDAAPPAPAPTAFSSWYPDRVWARPGSRTVQLQQAFAFDAAWEAPAAPTVPDIQPPVLAQVKIRTYPRALYTPSQPHFAVPVVVPVMSWTGIYLDPPPRRRVRHQPDHRPFPIDYDATINPPAPTFSWLARYPDRFPRKVTREPGLHAAPLYIPEVTTGPAPALSWRATFPERVPAKRRIRGGEPAYFADKFTAPAVVAAPDLAAPVYVNRVYGRQPLTHSPSYLAPEFVPDVTHPVGGMEWRALYPDRIDRRELPTYAKLSYTGVVFIVEFIPAPVLHEIHGRGSFNKRLFGKGSIYDTLRGKGSV